MSRNGGDEGTRNRKNVCVEVPPVGRRRRRKEQIQVLKTEFMTHKQHKQKKQTKQQQEQCAIKH